MTLRPQPTSPAAKTTLLPGRATAEGTAAYAARFDHLRGGFAPLGATGLHTSRLGFGCYRVARGIDDHADALRHALRGGINLIDTSTNYGDGASEELVGEALREVIERGDLARSEVIVVSKVGYVQGRNMVLARERAAAGRPFPEMVEYDDHCWHCLHPEFLADQLARSLARLGLATLDALLLHNPEYFLSAASRDGVTGAGGRGGKGAPAPEALRREYERRLLEAFRYLEGQVATGTIARYGVSSNTFPVPVDDPRFTSLERCLELAFQAGGATNRFAIAQMPGNLLETGLVAERNQAGGAQSAVDFAEERGLGVLINRPLNAFGPRGLVRLAEMPDVEPVDEVELDASLAPLAALETQLRAIVPDDSPLAEQASQLLAVSDLLRSHRPSIQDFEHWKQVAQQQFIPMAQFGLRAVQRALAESREAGDAPPTAVPPGDFEKLAAGYLQALSAVLQKHYSWFAAPAHRAALERRDAIARAVGKVNGRPEAERTLSQWAVALLLGLPGRPVVLAGMRRAEYVNDLLALFAKEDDTLDRHSFLRAAEALVKTR